MAVLYQLVLLLHGTLAFSAMAPYKSHAVHIHAETQDDKAEHDGKEGLGVLVGEVLHIGCKPVQTAPSCKPSSGIDILLIPLFVLGIVLIRHLFTHNEFLPTSHGCMQLV